MQIRHLAPRKSELFCSLFDSLALCKILTVNTTMPHGELLPNGTHEGAVRVSVLTAYKKKKKKAVRNSSIPSRASVRMRHILQGTSCSECLKRRGELATADVEIVAVFYNADVQRLQVASGLFSVLSLMALILRTDRK